MLYILQLIYVPNTASMNRLLGYCRELDKIRVKAKVVFLTPDDHYSKVTEKFTNIEFVYCWLRFLPYKGPFRKYTLRWSISLIMKKLQPGDMVYTYGINGLTKRAQSIKGVRTFAERTEHPDVTDGYGHPVLYLTKEDDDQVCRNLDGMFVISEPLRELYISRGVAPEKIHILNMTVDANRFKGVVKQPVDKRYIAYCGTASNNKDGVDELIKAFAIVSKEIPDIYLYIIGTTPSKEDQSGNMKLIEDLGVKERIVFTGRVNASDMPQMLTNAEVLLLDRPDNIQAKYGFPTKLGEYLLTGNPVVVTKVGDIPKFLTDGENALLANPCDAKDFSGKVLWALRNPEGAHRIGRKGAEMALQKFNNEHVTHDLASNIGVVNNL